MNSMLTKNAPATRRRTVLFRLASVAAALATLYHATALAVPAFARIAYPSDYPAARHVVFIVIDGSLVWLFLWRPIWLVWPYAVLTAQVIQGHGGAAWMLWQTQRRIDWISVLTAIAVPACLVLLALDWRERVTR